MTAPPQPPYENSFHLPPLRRSLPSAELGSRVGSTGSWALLVPLVAGLVASGCKVDRAAFNQRVFSCDTAATNPGCGTDDHGQPMACFAARQIGAPTDFCARMCPADPTTAEGVCLDSNVELRSCRPSDDTNIGEGAACNQTSLACLRTDLLADEGVCTTLRPCTQSTDCRDPVRSVCATEFLETSIYPQGGPSLRLDHLFCLETGCKARGTSCPPGESCLQDVVPRDAHPPDICVPNCDSHERCPPNFLCYRKVSSDAAPSVCIPGLLGFTCSSSIDCMVGTCTPTGIGYSVCTTECDTQADCERFDGEQGKFVCVKNEAMPTTPGVCQTPDAFRGSICRTSEDCVKRNPYEVCTRFDPADEMGVCLLPCTEEGKCMPRGGINHTCLPVPGDLNPPVCFPGYFGYPCATENNCVGQLACKPTADPSTSICTVGCASDADCGKVAPDPATGSPKGNRWIAGDGFCGFDVGSPICLPNGSLPSGTPCHTQAACKSGKCVNNVCAEAAK